MKNLKQKIQTTLEHLFFGERVQGEKLPIPKKFPERKFIQKEFEEWCREFNVTCTHNKKVVHFG
jgi:hypothetical protein